MLQTLASSLPLANRWQWLLARCRRARRIAASQLRAEWADLHAAWKIWADEVENRANPPRMLPLLDTLREPY